MSTLIKMFQDGGFFMYPIALMLILGVTIMVERLYMILFRYNANAPLFMEQVQSYILDNNIHEAKKLCNSKKDACLYQVFKAALYNTDSSFEEMQEHTEVATLSVIPKLQKRISYLFTFANVATLLGLLGTIVGLIQTFEAVAIVDAAEKQALLSTGISTAMNTTAFGLIVAIPCMLAYGFLNNRINSMVDEIHHYTGRLLMLLKTGKEYFEDFDENKTISTQQSPKVKMKNNEDKRNVA